MKKALTERIKSLAWIIEEFYLMGDFRKLEKGSKRERAVVQALLRVAKELREINL